MKNKILIFLNKFYIYRYLAYKIHKHNVLRNPKKEANRPYYQFFKKNINWEQPVNLIEKINWLQLNTDTSLWTKYADKYQVRDFVKESGFENYLPQLYGKWDNANDINFDDLPSSFVLKTNNGCGTVLIVRDKSELNLKSTREKLHRWLSIPYGYRASQLHYTKIVPCIIAEELLENSDENSSSIIDYKIWCFHGVPECILVFTDRKKDNYSLSLFDLKWKNISDDFLNTKSKHFSGKDIPKPKSLNKMLEMTRVLSKNLPQVRVDFYDVNGKPYFGEMTLASGFGYLTEDYYNYLGRKVDLNKMEKMI